MTGYSLRLLEPDEVPELRREAVDKATLDAAGKIVEEVWISGEAGLRSYAEQFGDLEPGATLVLGPEVLAAALAALPAADRGVLERTAARIRRFAEAQRESLRTTKVKVPGGTAGIGFSAVTRAGCYAPGGRFPLPSSVLMTTITAKVAGVAEVWVASPNPSRETLAAAALGGADALLAVGGAQAIAALAFGCGPVPACDVIVGPGNKWVTAAKQLVSGRVRIDMLAGPSELVVIADRSADPALVAADLLAQAEHDPEALPVLIAVDSSRNSRIVDAVNVEIRRQLTDLPTAETARAAVAGGFAVIVGGLQRAAKISDRLAPEHLALHLADPDFMVDRLKHYGAVFIGSGAAEVLGDYGAGPNHVLPTGGTARSIGGLSVLNFVRTQTWLRIDDPVKASPMAADAVALARMEGLEAHARSAERRIVK